MFIIHLLYNLHVCTSINDIGFSSSTSSGYKAWIDSRLNALPDLQPTPDMGDEKACPAPDQMHRARNWIPFHQRSEEDHERLHELAYRYFI